jgi:hypothetical protein
MAFVCSKNSPFFRKNRVKTAVNFFFPDRESDWRIFAIAAATVRNG